MSKTAAAQVPFAKKVAKLKASGKKAGGTPAAIIDSNRKYLIKAALAADADAKRNGVEACAHAPRARPDEDSADDAEKKEKVVDLRKVHERLSHRVGLLDKHEVLAVVGVTYPTLWAWMRAGTFPRSRIVGLKSKWLAGDIADWLAKLTVGPLKGDAKLTEAEVA